MTDRLRRASATTTGRVLIIAIVIITVVALVVGALLTHGDG